MQSSKVVRNVRIFTGEAINLAEARSLAQEHERLVSRRVTRK